MNYMPFTCVLTSTNSCRRYQFHILKNCNVRTPLRLFWATYFKMEESYDNGSNKNRDLFHFHYSLEMPQGVTWKHIEVTVFSQSISQWTLRLPAYWNETNWKTIFHIFSHLYNYNTWQFFRGRKIISHSIRRKLPIARLKFYEVQELILKLIFIIRICK